VILKLQHQGEANPQRDKQNHQQGINQIANPWQLPKKVEIQDFERENSEYSQKKLVLVTEPTSMVPSSSLGHHPGKITKPSPKPNAVSNVLVLFLHFSGPHPGTCPGSHGR
jgi:hypothetical protein